MYIFPQVKTSVWVCSLSPSQPLSSPKIKIKKHHGEIDEKIHEKENDEKGREKDYHEAP